METVHRQLVFQVNNVGIFFIMFVAHPVVKIGKNTGSTNKKQVPP